MTLSTATTATGRHDRGTEITHVPAPVLDHGHAAATWAEPRTVGDDGHTSSLQPESSTGLDDVYASAPLPEPPKEPVVDVTLRLMADPDPTLLPRVSALLGNIGVVPTKLSFLLLAENLAMITIELRGMAEYSIGLLQRKLASLPQCIPAED